VVLVTVELVVYSIVFICFVVLAVTVGIVSSLIFKLGMILTIQEEQIKFRSDSCKFLCMPIFENKNFAYVLP
jgi:hypothetical protein